MSVYTDVMLDLETTGLSKDHSAIMQIAAVKFNIHTRAVDGKVFNECLAIPPNRFWNEETRQWWSKMPDTLHSIYARMRDPKVVMEEFYWWSQGSSYRLWSKPASFDIPLIDSYFNEYGPANPYAHYKTRDLRSFIQGATFPFEFDEKAVPFVGTVHDALFDTLHQIKLLYAALDQAKVASTSCSPDTPVLILEA